MDQIDGLSPAISIDQKGASHNPRSTVGTVTEIYDYMRLLWARIGIPHCPIDGTVISRQTSEQIADRVLELPRGTRVRIMAPVVRGRKGEHHDILADARKAGFSRARVDGNFYELTEKIPLDKNKKHDIEIDVDRAVIDPDSTSRLRESVETAAKMSTGLVLVVPADGKGKELLFNQKVQDLHAFKLADNWGERKPRYNFLHDSRSESSTQYNWLVQWVLKGNNAVSAGLAKSSNVVGSRQWVSSSLQKYEVSVQHFLEHLLVLVHVSAGQPGRGKEILGTRYLNIVSGVRNLL